MSIFSPSTLWHAHNLPDRTIRGFKSAVIIIFLVLTALYFAPI
ncbi:hypothetical protein TR2A62_0015 [Thalassobium sp. R2A62]|nr:hypothetical protein TR2A62_0015 [Thalassobium sp. R2A62]